MRTEIEERIAGERIRVAIPISVAEAVAEIEPHIVQALASIRAGHMALTRVVVREGMKAAGRTGDLDAFYDGLVERARFAPVNALAYRALSDFYVKARETEDASGNSEAAGETPETTEAGTAASGSTG